jgi:octaprenyl-diphosphate synthase
MSEGAAHPTPAPPSAISLGLALVGPKLAAVEAEIQRNLTSPFGPIDEAGRYLATTSGKRLRPMLVLLSADLLGYRGEDDVLMGAVCELIHTATLVHDDIIDDAGTRRGRTTANRVFGNPFTVLLGDYLYIRSMNMALRGRNLRLVDVLADATEKMLEGEILADRLRGRSDVTPAQHLEIVERKTASLFSACCRVSAILAGAGDEAEERFSQYGLSLGIAFQLVDDLLDLTADETTVGKPVAADLREGRLTLPWIDLLERGTDEDRQGVLAVLREGSFENISFRRLRASLEKQGCLERTRDLAAGHAERARQLMTAFPPGPQRDVLLELPGAVLTRDR